jgi:hypothetical protein
MEIRKVTRQAAKLRVGFSALPFCGKTMGALIMAHGMTGDWSKILLVDTENGSGDLYEHLGEYNIIQLNDFSPNSYINAIKSGEKAGMEVIILDSITHEWQWCLDYQMHLGGKYQDWGRVKPLHAAFKQALLGSSCHIFTTNRRKAGYALEAGADGKLEVRKTGMKEVTEDGFDYELTIALEFEKDNTFTVTKDRTRCLKPLEGQVIVKEMGEALAQWCKGSGAGEEQLLQSALVDVSNCTSNEALTAVFSRYTSLQKNEDFLARLKEIKLKINK